MAEPAPKRAKLEEDEWTADANEATTLRLLPPGAGDAGAAAAFHPEMSHQLFGEEETFMGYRQPAASVLISHATFQHCISFRSAARRPGATQVQQILEEHLSEGLLGDEAALLAAHAAAPGLDASELGKPLLRSASGGDAVHSFPLSEAPAAVKEAHARAQQLLPLFVDGATALNQTEPGWQLLIAVRRINGLLVLVGFCTIYRLFAYPDSARLRISQILVLPPFQRQGLGRLLMEAAFQLADAERAQDVLVEEPTDEVQALRERIELARALALPWLAAAAGQRQTDSPAADGSAGGQPPASLALDAASLARAQRELRLPKQEVRRVWEALLARQAAFQAEPGASVLRGLVARRLFGGFADTKRQAVGKQIFTHDEAGSFCMCRVPRAAGIKGMPVALEDRAGEGQSPEEREEALEAAVEQRMGQLQAAAAPA